jgi:hypothetical protein
MTIVEFLELTAGQWFSHRTSHYVSTNEQNGMKSNLAVELLLASHADVQQLCQTYQLNPDQLYAAQISWESLPELSGRKQSGGDVLVFVPDPDHPETGSVYRKQAVAGTMSPGRYDLAADERLTLTTVDENVRVEEHLWFESPNFRLRHSVIQQKGGPRVISFASEIRRVVTPPAQS